MVLKTIEYTIEMMESAEIGDLDGVDAAEAMLLEAMKFGKDVLGWNVHKVCNDLAYGAYCVHFWIKRLEL